MKYFGIFFVVLIASTLASAENLACDVLINNEIKVKKNLTTTEGRRMILATLPELTAYITEKKNHEFTIEAFIPAQDARIYAEGKIADVSDTLTASLWGREIVIDVRCQSKNSATE